MSVSLPLLLHSIKRWNRRKGKVVFNVYGRTATAKPSNLRGGELVEENLYVSTIGAPQEADETHSMQSIELVFTDGAGDKSPEPERGEEEEEEAEKLSLGSGMDVKINFIVPGDDESDTAL